MYTAIKTQRTRIASALVGAIGIATLAASPASAVIDPAHQFIVNGGFENLTNGLGQIGYNTNAVGWTNNINASNELGYNFVMGGSTASTTGANGVSGNLQLWGPGNGSNNGLTASPTGGNFLANDGAYQTASVSQAITGLIIGQTYQLSFNYAAAQQKGYDGATTEAWFYGLQNEGGVTANKTATLNNPNHGFTGWYSQTYNFVATSTSDTLYFLAAGTPTGQPPFSLLDSVSLTGAFGTVSAAPDSETWELMMVGFGIIGYSLRKRPRRKNGSEKTAKLAAVPAIA